MDTKKLAEMLKATLSLDPAQRVPAEEQLNQVKQPCASPESEREKTIFFPCECDFK